MADTKLNLELLRKVRDRIAAVPESYNQAAFYVERNRKAPCGIVACLAGEIIICSEPTIEEGISKAFKAMYAPVLARELAGIPFEADIFSQDGSGFPEPFARQFQQAETKRERAVVAVAYLDECLKRKAVTW